MFIRCFDGVVKIFLGNCVNQRVSREGAVRDTGSVSKRLSSTQTVSFLPLLLRTTQIAITARMTTRALVPAIM